MRSFAPQPAAFDRIGRLSDHMLHPILQVFDFDLSGKLLALDMPMAD
jgi:hypothetical protein